MKTNPRAHVTGQQQLELADDFVSLGQRHDNMDHTAMPKMKRN